MFKRYILTLVNIVLALFLLTSCVYYNTFYNAQKYFASAQKQPVSETGRPPARVIQDYDKVIERCTYILREHPNSRWADDALFLLARSMFYKRQNILQAKERFQDMLNIFPDSKHIPESIIYIAKIDHQLNNFNEAISRLNSILSEQKFYAYHSSVLLLKSKWHIAKGNNEQARDNLLEIIENYSRSNEFEEAYLNLGLSYLNTENYKQSKELFESLLKSRPSRRISLNARYNIALNDFYLKNLPQAMDETEQLLRDEYELTAIPRVQILKARILAAKSDDKAAEAILRTVIEDNRRSAIASESSFYLAEIYFLKMGEYEKALDYFNRVSSEFVDSPYVEKALGRSSVVSQLIQLNRVEDNQNIEQLIQEHFKLAEYYLYVMNLPDSALSVYNSIEMQANKIKKRIDDLDKMIEEDQVETDSLDISKLINESDNLKNTLEQYRQVYVPYSMFLSAWVYMQILDNVDKAEELMIEMEERFPDNVYHYAIKRLINNQDIIFSHPIEIEKQTAYQKAMDIMQEDKESGIKTLNDLLLSVKRILSYVQQGKYPELEQLQSRIIYSIGFSYYYDLQDTSEAKHYFDKIISQYPESEYKDFIQTFYRNNTFIVRDSLSYYDDKIESNQTIDEEKDYSSEEPNKDEEQSLRDQLKLIESLD